METPTPNTPELSPMNSTPTTPSPRKKWLMIGGLILLLGVAGVFASQGTFLKGTFNASISPLSPTKFVTAAKGTEFYLKWNITPFDDSSAYAPWTSSTVNSDLVGYVNSKPQDFMNYKWEITNPKGEVINTSDFNNAWHVTSPYLQEFKTSHNNTTQACAQKVSFGKWDPNNTMLVWTCRMIPIPYTQMEEMEKAPGKYSIKVWVGNGTTNTAPPSTYELNVPTLTPVQNMKFGTQDGSNPYYVIWNAPASITYLKRKDGNKDPVFRYSWTLTDNKRNVWVLSYDGSVITDIPALKNITFDKVKGSSNLCYGDVVLHNDKPTPYPKGWSCNSFTIPSEVIAQLTNGETYHLAVNIDDGKHSTMAAKADFKVTTGGKPKNDITAPNNVEGDFDASGRPTAFKWSWLYPDESPAPNNTYLNVLFPVFNYSWQLVHKDGISETVKTDTMFGSKIVFKDNPIWTKGFFDKPGTQPEDLNHCFVPVSRVANGKSELLDPTWICPEMAVPQDIYKSLKVGQKYYFKVQAGNGLEASYYAKSDLFTVTGNPVVPTAKPVALIKPEVYELTQKNSDLDDKNLIFEWKVKPDAANNTQLMVKTDNGTFAPTYNYKFNLKKTGSSENPVWEKDWKSFSATDGLNTKCVDQFVSYSTNPSTKVPGTYICPSLMLPTTVMSKLVPGVKYTFTVHVGNGSNDGSKSLDFVIPSNVAVDFRGTDLTKRDIPTITKEDVTRSLTEINDVALNTNRISDKTVTDTASKDITPTPAPAPAAITIKPTQFKSAPTTIDKAAKGALPNFSWYKLTEYTTLQNETGNAFAYQWEVRAGDTNAYVMDKNTPNESTCYVALKNNSVNFRAWSCTDVSIPWETIYNLKNDTNYTFRVRTAYYDSSNNNVLAVSDWANTSFKITETVAATPVIDPEKGDIIFFSTLKGEYDATTGRVILNWNTPNDGKTYFSTLLRDGQPVLTLNEAKTYVDADVEAPKEYIYKVMLYGDKTSNVPVGESGKVAIPISAKTVADPVAPVAVDKPTLKIVHFGAEKDAKSGGVVVFYDVEKQGAFKGKGLKSEVYVNGILKVTNYDDFQEGVSVYAYSPILFNFEIKDGDTIKIVTTTTDPADAESGVSDSQEFVYHETAVAQEEKPVALTLVTTTIPNGKAGDDFYLKFEAKGGTSSYIWDITDATKLPEGLTFKDGILSGKTQKPGTYTVEISVHDKNIEESAVATYSFSIEALKTPVPTGGSSTSSGGGGGGVIASGGGSGGGSSGGGSSGSGITKPTNYFTFKFQTSPFAKHKDILNSPLRTQITVLVNAGVMSGYNKTFFGPDDTLTRAQFLKMVVNAFQLKTPSQISIKPCKDVAKNAWYSKYFVTAQNLSIIKGFQDGTCRPDQAVTRAEATKILFLAIANIQGKTQTVVVADGGGAGYINPFTDITPQHSLFKYVASAEKYGFVKGITKGIYAPDVPLSRSQGAKILVQALTKLAVPVK